MCLICIVGCLLVGVLIMCLCSCGLCMCGWKLVSRVLIVCKVMCSWFVCSV